MSYYLNVKNKLKLFISRYTNIIFRLPNYSNTRRALFDVLIGYNTPVLIITSDLETTSKWMVITSEANGLNLQYSILTVDEFLDVEGFFNLKYNDYNVVVDITDTTKFYNIKGFLENVKLKALTTIILDHGIHPFLEDDVKEQLGETFYFRPSYSTAIYTELVPKSRIVFFRKFVREDYVNESITILNNTNKANILNVSYNRFKEYPQDYKTTNIRVNCSPIQKYEYLLERKITYWNKYKDSVATLKRTAQNLYMRNLKALNTYLNKLRMDHSNTLLDTLTGKKVLVLIDGAITNDELLSNNITKKVLPSEIIRSTTTSKMVKAILANFKAGLRTFIFSAMNDIPEELKWSEIEVIVLFTSSATAINNVKTALEENEELLVIFPFVNDTVDKDKVKKLKTFVKKGETSTYSLVQRVTEVVNYMDKDYNPIFKISKQ